MQEDRERQQRREKQQGGAGRGEARAGPSSCGAGEGRRETASEGSLRQERMQEVREEESSEYRDTGEGRREAASVGARARNAWGGGEGYQEEHLSWLTCWEPSPSSS